MARDNLFAFDADDFVIITVLAVALKISTRYNSCMAALNDILDGLIDPDHGDFSLELARYVLDLRFSDERAARYQALATKNQHGALSPAEHDELEAFVTANTMLMILKTKARRSRVERPSAA